MLLATPLARSLKHAWPKADIDMLVFQGTEGALAENPDIAEVIGVPRRAAFAARIAELRALWRRYDLALTPLATDRARFYCWAAGRWRVGPINAGVKDRAKTLLLNQTLNFDDLDTHTVAMGLRLAEILGIEPCYEVVPPRIAPGDMDALLARLGPLAGHPFAVLHLYPKFTYKMWTPAAWVTLIQWLHQRGLAVVFTGGAEPAELAYIDAIARALPDNPLTLNLAGTLTLGATAELIRRARLYVGPDTAVTHIAAATGTPTVALFGPSNPVKWGPWPHGWTSGTSPWQRRGSHRRGNVFLLQGPGDCVPCMLEGCQRNIQSKSECLEQLSARTVIEATETLLADAAPAA
ncbi:MAG: glycosyltransferase family 9 protein [Proteobacteria bacterium]|nr:glycosyltransferase family 9 protein [Pseudomonadota bacterium]